MKTMSLSTLLAFFATTLFANPYPAECRVKVANGNYFNVVSSAECEALAHPSAGNVDTIEVEEDDEGETAVAAEG